MSIFQTQQTDDDTSAWRHTTGTARAKATNDDRNQWVEAAEAHIEVWSRANPPKPGRYMSAGMRAQVWARGPGTTLLYSIVCVGVVLLGAGYLWGHGLYDIGEAIALGGGGLWARLLMAIDTGGTPV